MGLRRQATYSVVKFMKQAGVEFPIEQLLNNTRTIVPTTSKNFTFRACVNPQRYVSELLFLQEMFVPLLNMVVCKLSLRVKITVSFPIFSYINNYFDLDGLDNRLTKMSFRLRRVLTDT